MALNPLGARRREQESAKILQDSLTLGCNAAAGALKNIIGNSVSMSAVLLFILFYYWNGPPLCGDTSCCMRECLVFMKGSFLFLTICVLAIR